MRSTIRRAVARAPGNRGWGVLINQSIHTLDLLVYLFGQADAVCAGMANHHLKEIIEVEDTMEAYIEFENGKSCFLCNYRVLRKSFRH